MSSLLGCVEVTIINFASLYIGQAFAVLDSIKFFILYFIYIYFKHNYFYHS